MRLTMKTPCPSCPFRTDIPPFLTEGRGREIMAALLADHTFQCHKTVDYDGADDEGEVDSATAASEPNAQHCAGALILLEKIGRPNQLMRIAERIGHYRPDRLDMKAPVFDTAAKFIRGQTARRGKFGRRRVPRNPR